MCIMVSAQRSPRAAQMRPFGFVPNRNMAAMRCSVVLACEPPLTGDQKQSVLLGNHSELSQHAQHIRIHPLLDNLAVGKAVNRQARHCHRMVGGWDALYLSAVRAMRGPAYNDFVICGNDVFDADPNVRKRRARCADALLRTQRPTNREG